MLDRFRQAKQAEIRMLMELAAAGAMPPPFAGNRPAFAASLRATAPTAVIADYKRASPSKGDINLAATPEEVAAAYAAAGAGALSVLTEQDHFKGNPEFLARMTAPGLPLLRKDFILHPLQIAQSAATPASAVLIIVRMLDDAMLRALLILAHDSGLEPVVEIFDETDLRRARAVGAPIIQVNNRNLDSLAVDRSASRRLAARKFPGEFWITASGITDRASLMELLDLGFDAALVGGALMEDGAPGNALGRLLRGRHGHD
jgi:indole-3-glycerol phosphate synthase